MFYDVSFVITVIGCCAIIGFPVCLLVLPRNIRLRFIIAAPIGFGVVSFTTLLAYMSGLPLRTVVLAETGIGAVVALSALIKSKRSASDLTANQVSVLIFCTTAVGFLAVLPAWTGGPNFTIFQGNAYDQFHSFLTGAVAFSNYDYATIAREAASDGGNPVLARAMWWVNNRGTVSVVQAAFMNLTEQDSFRTNYLFRAALQINMLFASYFLFVNIFRAGLWLSFFLAAGLTLGFFEQYPIDINAWSHLAMLPFELLLAAAAVLAFSPERAEEGAIGAVRVAGLFAIILAVIIYNYPESLPVHATIVASITLVAAVFDRSRSSAIGVATIGLGIACALVIALPCWSSTIVHGYRQVGAYSTYDLDWWQYFQRYLLGSESNHFMTLLHPSGVSTGKLADALFSLPVEGVISAIGLHFTLPTASWPVAAAIVWKLALYVFVVVLFGGAASTALRLFRANPSDNRSRMIAGAFVACGIPVGILAKGLYWAAGKGLTIVAPMLFVVLAVALLVPRLSSRAARIASAIFVIGHLMLGVLRPIAAADATGARLTGFPQSAGQIETQKSQIDWDASHMKAALGGCHEVALDVDRPLIAKFAALVLTDMGLPWSTIAPINLDDGDRRYRTDRWAQADCLVTTQALVPEKGKRTISLSTDRDAIDFVQGTLNRLEIGTKQHPGVTVKGAYGIEILPFGRLQWTSPSASFEIPNSEPKPAKRLALALWPMPLSSGTRLTVEINGVSLFDDAVPTNELNLPLDQFASDKRLVIQLRTNAATRYPGDTRELGVALKVLTLDKTSIP